MQNILRYVYALWSFASLILLILIFGVLSIVLQILFIKSKKAHFWLLRSFSKAYLLLCQIKVCIEGLENIPESGNFILISNYQSDIQHLAFLAYFPRRFRFIMSNVLARSPFFGRMLKSAGHIPITDLMLEKQGPWGRSYSVEKAIHHLKNGEIIFILPEGHISLTGNMGPFNPGVVVMAYESGRSIIPCAVTGAHEIAPPPDYSKIGNIGGHLLKIFLIWTLNCIKTFKCGEIKIKIGTPIRIKSMDSPETEAKKLKSIIQDML
ncbi:lysophospholipid acyltransferase family protein [Candidatus Margulisiibacteriota bacterium]